MVDEYDGAPEDEDDEDRLDKFELGIVYVTCTIRLTREQGGMIKDLIQDIYPHTFPHYCMKVGISTPNFYNTLNGERPCTLEFFNKLLSGIQYVATISNPEIQIRELPIGGIVHDVDSITQDIESQSNDQEEQDTPDSYS